MHIVVYIFQRTRNMVGSIWDQRQVIPPGMAYCAVLTPPPTCTASITALASEHCGRWRDSYEFLVEDAESMFSGTRMKKGRKGMLKSVIF